MLSIWYLIYNQKSGGLRKSIRLINFFYGNMTPKQEYRELQDSIKKLVWSDDDTIIRLNTILRYIETVFRSEHEEKRALFEKYLPVIVYMSVTGMI